MKKFLALLVSLLFVFSSFSALATKTIVIEDDSLSSAETTLSGSSDNKVHNISLAAESINGWCVAPGESFSFNNIVGERTKALGFKSAVNGRGVTVCGGGVSQLATTIYLALKDTGLVRFGEIHTYGFRFTDNYVDDGDLAIVTDYANGQDLSFTNRSRITFRIDIEITDSAVIVTINEGNELGLDEATATASSYVTGNKPTVDGSKVFDGDIETAWNVRENNGIGESVFITVNDGETRTFTGISILNGYCKSTTLHGEEVYLWSENSRVKSVDIYADGRFVGTFRLEDSDSWQMCKFDTPVTANEIEIMILSTYKGDTYKDVCISEVKLFCK